MCKAGRLSFYCITTFPLLSSWGVRPALSSGGGEATIRNARSPNSRGRLSFNLTTRPATKHQKGKPGKGSPRLEKKRKKRKEEVEGQRCGGVMDANMWSCRGSGFLAWLKGSRKELNLFFTFLVTNMQALGELLEKKQPAITKHCSNLHHYIFSSFNI